MVRVCVCVLRLTRIRRKGALGDGTHGCYCWVSGVGYYGETGQGV